MSRTSRTAALVVLAGAILAPVTAAEERREPPPAKTLKSERTFVLQAGTHTYTMPVQRIGEDANALVPCWGFELEGGGLNYAAGDLAVIGKVTPEPGQEGTEDGGIGAVRQADGSFAYPAERAAITDERLRRGARCASVDWAFYGADGRPKPVTQEVWLEEDMKLHARSASVRKAARAAMKRKARKRARAAQAGGVQVVAGSLQRVGERGLHMVVTIRATQDAASQVRLTTHATTILQQLDGAR